MRVQHEKNVEAINKGGGLDWGGKKGADYWEEKGGRATELSIVGLEGLQDGA